jgi:RNA polymerase sigma factor (sigma-70 family)
MVDTLHQLIERLRQAGGLTESGRMADEELLDRFVRSRDEAAFEVLVWRHGGMVLASAQRLLGNSSDAEDAFQATFLTLALKAGTVRNGRCLAGWLHQIACRVANRLRRVQGLHRAGTSLDERIPAAAKTPRHEEYAGVLDLEIERLPEGYRRAVVLHYLEGRSTEEIATMLGCPRGTVLSRLAAARKILQRRLERRGVAISVAAALTASAPQAVRGEIAASIPLIGFAGTDAIRPNVRSLAQGVIRTMFWHRYRIPVVIAFLALGCLVSVGVGRADKSESSPPPNQPALPHDEKPVDVSADAAKLQSLLEERRDNLQKGYDELIHRKDLESLAATLEQRLSFQDRLLDVDLELSHTPKQRLEAYERALQRSKDFEKWVHDRVEGGLQQPHDLKLVKDNRLKVEIAMLKEKMRQQGK